MQLLLLQLPLSVFIFNLPLAVAACSSRAAEQLSAAHAAAQASDSKSASPTPSNRPLIHFEKYHSSHIASRARGLSSCGGGGHISGRNSVHQLSSGAGGHCSGNSGAGELEGQRTAPGDSSRPQQQPPGVVTAAGF